MTTQHQSREFPADAVHSLTWAMDAKKATYDTLRPAARGPDRPAHRATGPWEQKRRRTGLDPHHTSFRDIGWRQLAALRGLSSQSSSGSGSAIGCDGRIAPKQQAGPCEMC